MRCRSAQGLRVKYKLCVCAAALEKKVRELYDAVCRLEEEKYDWEGKLGRQTEEVHCHHCQCCCEQLRKIARIYKAYVFGSGANHISHSLLIIIIIIIIFLLLFFLFLFG